MILILLTVLAAAWAAAALLRTSVAVAAPTAIFSVIVVLFVFGLVDQLRLGSLIVLTVIALGALAGVVIQLRSGGVRALLAWAFPPVVVLYLGMLGGYGFSSGGLRFSSWDEFSLWGRSVAGMVHSNALPPLATAELDFLTYPPGLLIWEYFVAGLRPVFVEADVFLAYQAFALALFLPFAARLQWRRPRHLLFFVASTLLLVTVFSSFHVVLIDPILAMTFGYCAALALLGSMDGRSLWRHLGPALAVLSLLKDTGILLALIVLIVLLARIGVQARAQGRSGRASRSPAWLVHGGIGLLCLGVPAVLWRLFLAVVGVDRGDASPSESVWTRVQDALFYSEDSYRSRTTASFVEALTDRPLTQIPVPLSFAAWFVLGVLLLIGADAVRRSVRATTEGGDQRPSGNRWAATVPLALGSLVYLVAIWLTYILAFSEYEATNLASYERYVMLYWLGTMVVVLAVALWALGSREVVERRPGGVFVRRVVLGFALVLLVLSNISEIASVGQRQHVAQAAAVREPYDWTAVTAWRSGVTSDDSVWILDQYATGFGYWVLKHEFLELRTAGWSVGPPRDEADQWTNDLSVEEWSEQLAEFDYLVIHHVEWQFTDRFASLFENPEDIHDHSVFAVEERSEAGLALVAVD